MQSRPLAFPSPSNLQCGLHLNASHNHLRGVTHVCENLSFNMIKESGESLHVSWFHLESLLCECFQEVGNFVSKHFKVDLVEVVDLPKQAGIQLFIIVIVGGLVLVGDVPPEVRIYLSEADLLCNVEEVFVEGLRLEDVVVV